MQVLAAICVLAGAVAVYVASPNQRLVAPMGAISAAWRRVGALMLLAGTGLWMILLHPAAGFFTALTLAMLAWVMLPYIAAWRQVRQRTRSHDAAR